jgi:hypothetical protein
VAVWAGSLSDLYCFEPAKNTWKTILPSGPKPSKVYKPGFASAPDGVIYHIGGRNDDGKREGAQWGCARALIVRFRHDSRKYD